MDRNYEDIISYIKTIRIIDTHEHLPSWEKFRDGNRDFLSDYLSHYLSSDMISSGMEDEVLNKARDASIPVEERWELIEPFWNNCRFTGYGRAARIALSELHGFNEIHGGNIKEIQASYEKTFTKDYFRYILKNKCNIEISILDNWDNIEPDPEFFILSPNINELIMPREKFIYEGFMKETSMRITDFHDWVKMAVTYIEKKCAGGTGIFKCSLAYSRKLEFAEAGEDEAEKEFNEFILPSLSDKNNNRLGYDVSSTNSFQNFMMHEILNLLEGHKVAIQFHTGIQEGNSNDVRKASPMHLVNLFGKYPELRFDLFHMSYPYYLEAGVLAKNYRNVFLDMCWAHIISAASSINALSEWIDTVPINKISAFGGDYIFPDGIYGHLAIARENVAVVLADKVNNGIMSLNEAKGTAERLFRLNPIEIFRLKVKK